MDIIGVTQGVFFIGLTKCLDIKAFYELVFHEIYELLVDTKWEGHEKVVPEERHYIEEKFGMTIENWAPLEDEIINTLYPLYKKELKHTLGNCGEFSRTWEEIQERAKKLGL